MAIVSTAIRKGKGTRRRCCRKEVYGASITSKEIESKAKEHKDKPENKGFYIMGFWGKAFDVAKNVGTAVVGEIESSANEIREIKQKYEEMSDDELLKVVKSDGFFGKTKKEKGVAFGILKKRGYSIEEINESV